VNGIAPDPVTEAGDLLDRVLAAGNPEASASSLILVIRSGRGGGALRAAFERRLGEERTRENIARSLSLQSVGAGSHLLGQLADFIQHGSPEQAAIDVTRILSDAVGSGTSEARLMPPVLALIRALSSLEGPISDQRAPPAIQPHKGHQGGTSRPDPAQSSMTTKPRQAAGGARPPSDHPASFRVPDLVERVGEYGEILIAPLFRAEREGRGPGPVRIPAALPPPPDTSDPDLIRSWLRGEPAFMDMIGISAGLLEAGDPGDLMELEAEFHADPKGALRLYKARSPVSDGTADAAWCARVGRDIGRFGVTHDRGVEILARTLSRHLLSRDPERAAPLLRAGAVLRVREELAEAVCGLIDTEQDYLSDGPDEISGPPQNLMGSFSPNADLSEGRCLERAIFLHLETGVPLGSAMRQSLTEFRLAQALRANPDAPLDFLDRRYAIDAALPMAELCGREPIVRIGFTEPAF
jgi:hypothetical protein